MSSIKKEVVIPGENQPSKEDIVKYYKALAKDVAQEALKFKRARAREIFNEISDGALRRNYQDETAYLLHLAKMAGFKEFENLSEDGILKSVRKNKSGGLKIKQADLNELLRLSAEVGDIVAGKLFLNCGADKNTDGSLQNSRFDTEKGTPIKIAVNNGREEFVNFLLEQGPGLRLTCGASEEIKVIHLADTKFKQCLAAERLAKEDAEMEKQAQKALEPEKQAQEDPVLKGIEEQGLFYRGQAEKYQRIYGALIKYNNDPQNHIDPKTPQMIARCPYDIKRKNKEVSLQTPGAP